MPKITALTALPSPSYDDLMYVVDDPGGATPVSKKVTVQNLFGSIINVDWYGAVGNGVTDDTAAIQAAINTAVSTGYGQTRPGRILIQLNPGKAYVITNPINLCNMQGITIDGGSSQMGAVIVAKCTGKAAFEIIGSQAIELRNLQVWGNIANTPSMAFWVSRSNAVGGANSTMVTFRNVYTYGYFTKCVYYGLETEDNHFYDCVLNTYGGGLVAVAYIARANDLALTPVHTTLLGAAFGSYNINFQNCHLTMDGAVNTARALYARDTMMGVSLRDCYLASFGLDPIELEGVNRLDIQNIGMEGTYNNSIKLTLRNIWDTTQIVAINVSLGAPANYSLYADDTTILTDSYFIKCEPGYSGGAYKPFRLYRATNCDFTGVCKYIMGTFDITIDTAYSSNCKFRKGLDDTISWINGAYSGGDIIDDFSVYPYVYDFATGGVHVKLPGSWVHPLYLGVYSIWVDATGDLRIKSGAPGSDLDGAVVGSQS